MSRKRLIAANWKMYKNPAQTEDFFRDFLPLVAGHDRNEIVVCPPYVDLQAALQLTNGTQVAVGAQDVYWKDEGAFTGEISPSMLTAIGCTHVILGHSERRQYFGETDDTVNLKLKAALEYALTPIVCIGEVLEEREAGLTEDVLRRQCMRAFSSISGKKATKLVVAYEPVWAIGTGKTATPQMASDAHVLIRGEAAKAFGQGFADALRILYGGSVKQENATELLSYPVI
jgi:triosephosphate isomerase